MKRILITGGPTNEYIDEVMKITNMSTGSLSLDLAKCAADAGCEVTLIVTESVTGTARYGGYGLARDPNVTTVPIETTQDMFDALHSASLEPKGYDAVIHAAAVGDYTPAFTFRLEDMAAELAAAVLEMDETDETQLAEALLDIMADPRCKVNDDSKISSYEPHLTVKLTLTQKLIAQLRGWFPDAVLIGSKLLENVTTDHLVRIAQKLCIKNNMDFIMANDLAELRNGKPYRYLVTQDGFTGITLNGPGQPALLEYAKEHWF
ncbi:MAG: phosphopantothenoylcysteine decarboxylase [Eubacteriales bacterium]|nr:phosphopantothenoylcysteine decarboxylase [Eubacteriales bacterium]MDD4286173.1 phosphopantothenoylcysteine decarboxylase [Eubacteriales bacterium]